MTQEKLSIARGDKLTPDTWNEFVSRLRHDCIGKGVENHYTADAIFIVQVRKIICGLDMDFTNKKMVFCDDQQWFSVQEYWDDLEDNEKDGLNSKSVEMHGEIFPDLSEFWQWDMLSELDNHTVTGWDETWEYVNSHFTNDAAEAFILRKKHDYKNGLRVYVDAQSYCYEFNIIKQAIIDGRITLIDSSVTRENQP